MKQRIWELDAFRGLCILGMLVIHTVYDLVELYELANWTYTPFFMLVMDWGGVAFILLSGICATLGSRPLLRGAVVFSCGMLCTLVTFGLSLLELADASIVIYFGILHCLGCCMMLWPLFRKLPAPVLTCCAVILIATGFACSAFPVNTTLLVPLGLVYPGFQSADYFPLLPNFGFFLLGIVLGRIVYQDRTTRFPRVNSHVIPIRFLSACGRHSLIIYLLHQPVITLLLSLLTLLRRFP